jgi:hypothetical protein
MRRGSLLLVLAVAPATVQGIESSFLPIPPCRLVDTRQTANPLLPGVVQTFTFRGRCRVPGLTGGGGRESNIATALALNIVAVGATGPGFITIWPANQTMPLASSINYSSVTETGGLNIANGIIMPMCDQVTESPCSSGDVSFRAAVNPVHLVVDVVGYFAKPYWPMQQRYGAGPGLDNFLCLRNGMRSGLSSMEVTWEHAEHACPTGTRVCFSNELPVGVGICDTTRGDDTCDWRDCDGSCRDQPANAHLGWIRDFVASEAGLAGAVSEQMVATQVVPTCSRMPVWCCSPD